VDFWDGCGGGGPSCSMRPHPVHVPVHLHEFFGVVNGYGHVDGDCGGRGRRPSNARRAHSLGGGAASFEDDDEDEDD
jgi:hypothetical protein